VRSARIHVLLHANVSIPDNDWAKEGTFEDWMATRVFGWIEEDQTSYILVQKRLGYPVNDTRDSFYTHIRCA
jgi:hypothetical protein